MIQDDLLIKLAQTLVHQPNTFRALADRGDQRVHFGARVVERERRARRAGRR